MLNGFLLSLSLFSLSTWMLGICVKGLQGSCLGYKAEVITKTSTRDIV